MIREMGTRHGVRKGPGARINALREAPPDAGSTREGPGNLWGGPGVVPRAQSDGGDEDATLSRGGGVMMRAARPVYKGTAPRIGRPVTVREGTF